MIQEQLDVWFDPVRREGPEAMAVDEWLLENVKKPLLRVYEWDGEWGSLGYFSKVKEAREVFPGLNFVRRWTGGGVVDHRGDWTYSLVVPDGVDGVRVKRGESYRMIHEVLSAVLRREGLASELAGGFDSGGAVCFQSPVEYDVMNGAGVKLAGAAQRRGRAGLLHQGSVVGGEACGRERGLEFAEGLSGSWEEVFLEVCKESVGELVEDRYGCGEWLERC